MACRLLNPRSLSTSVLAYISFSHLKKGNLNKTTKIFIQENLFESDTYIIIKFILNLNDIYVKMQQLLSKRMNFWNYFL